MCKKLVLCKQKEVNCFQTSHNMWTKILQIRIIIITKTHQDIIFVPIHGSSEANCILNNAEKNSQMQISLKVYSHSPIQILSIWIEDALMWQSANLAGITKKKKNKKGQAFSSVFIISSLTLQLESCNMKSKSTLHQIIFATFQSARATNKNQIFFCFVFFVFLSLLKGNRKGGLVRKSLNFFEVSTSDRPLVSVKPDFNKATFSHCYIFDLFWCLSVLRAL